jgi:hypothetical protein
MRSSVLIGSLEGIAKTLMKVIAALKEDQKAEKRDKRPVERARLGLPIHSENLAVPPGGVVSLCNFPQIPFRPDGLIISRDVAEHFDVISVQIGANHQTLAYGTINASVFILDDPSKAREGEHRSDLESRLCWEEAPVGIKVNIQVRNKSAKPQTFYCLVVGDQTGF